MPVSVVAQPEAAEPCVSQAGPRLVGDLTLPAHIHQGLENDR